ncbi:MAG: DUF1926 domain-containing protein, partial [Planctomycetales bacterium]
EMYARMMMVSNRLRDLRQGGGDGPLLEEAKTELYRGQCNCSYWHGAFGGLYLPHLRNAVYSSLIAADNLLEQSQRGDDAWIEVRSDDYNLDARQEASLNNDKLLALFAPTRGGMLYELDSRSIRHNLLATLARRPEAYHRKVLAGPSDAEGEVASIHDRVVFKQADLDQKLIYDQFPRKSLIDHFYDVDAGCDSVARCEAMERGDFAAGVYEAVIRRGVDHGQVQMTRQGNAWGHPLTITKRATLQAGGSVLRFDYELTELPKDRPFHFAVEFNLAGLPSGADDRYFHRDGERLGHLGTPLDLYDQTNLSLTDEWLGVEVAFSLSRPSGLWTFPIETVSQSEGGFELVHQSVVVQPHWLVQGDEEGRWSVSMEMKIDTSLAESRQSPAPETAAATE